MALDVLGITFVAISILGIVLLFLIKSWEEKHGRILAPALKFSADKKAIEFKQVLLMTQVQIGKLGPTSMRVARIILHDLALSLASLSRASERQAHRLADLVSHKHRFERRESKNRFLKQVSNFKSSKDDRNTDSMDVTE